MNEQAKSATEYCQGKIDHFKKKANHNKTESLTCFLAVMLGTLISPLFITLGSEVWTAKVIPASLSAVAAFSTAWLQLRKPQQLWALYRSVQREAEDNLTKYLHQICDYADCNNPDKLLVENIARISLTAHKSWLPIMPNPEELKSLKTTPQKK